MTLEEIKDKCDELGITYQYGLIEENTEPPYICGIIADSNNFEADNIVYKKINTINLYYVYKVKDLEIESKIEDNLLADVVWRKDAEVYYSDQDVWQVIYTFNI
jgi:hypothetical protein